MNRQWWVAPTLPFLLAGLTSIIFPNCLCILPELSNSWSPPAELGVYLLLIKMQDKRLHLPLRYGSYSSVCIAKEFLNKSVKRPVVMPRQAQQVPRKTVALFKNILSVQANYFINPQTAVHRQHCSRRSFVPGAPAVPFHAAQDADQETGQQRQRPEPLKNE